MRTDPTELGIGYGEAMLYAFGILLLAGAIFLTIVEKQTKEPELKDPAYPAECDCNYYEIRSQGKCPFADIVHGNIYCSNPNCGRR